MVWIGLIWFGIGTSGELLWVWRWTFGFHEMLGSSWVAAQLIAPQEGLSYVSINGMSLSNNECYFLKHKLPFMVYHQNIRSIRGKTDELLSMWCNIYPHVLCLSEHLRNQEISTVCCRPYFLAAKYCRNISVEEYVFTCMIRYHLQLLIWIVIAKSMSLKYVLWNYVCIMSYHLLCNSNLYISKRESSSISALDSVLNKLHSY
jgi:hypothetical protein